MGPILLIMFEIPLGQKTAPTKMFFIMPLKKPQNKTYGLVPRQFCRWIMLDFEKQSLNNFNIVQYFNVEYNFLHVINLPPTFISYYVIFCFFLNFHFIIYISHITQQMYFSLFHLMAALFSGCSGHFVSFFDILHPI